MRKGGASAQVRLSRLVLESLAWLMFIVTNVVPAPFVIGAALGLGPDGVARLADRLFFAIGVTSLMQLALGHRRAIVEGPGGMWWGIFVSVGLLGPALGVPRDVLRRALEGGLVASGALGVLIGLFRPLVRRIETVFRPAVTAALLVLLTSELAPSMARGIIGAPPSLGDFVTGLVAFVAVVVVAVAGRGLLRTASFLIGAVSGILAAVAAHVPFQRLGPGPLLAPPHPLAWGAPVFLSGIFLTCLVTGVLLLSNLLAAVRAMAEVTEEPLDGEEVRRAIAVNGVSNVLAGLLAVPGLVPYASGAGFASLTGSRDRLPFLLAALAMVALGLMPEVGRLLVLIPVPVVYALLLAAFAQILGLGIADLAHEGLPVGRLFVVTAPILIGIGDMALPASFWHTVGSPLAFLAGNGIIVGLVGVLVFLPLARWRSEERPRG